MPPFRLRLSYSQSISFSLPKTIIGCFIITLGIVAVIIATISTKGSMPSPDVVYLSNLTDPAYMCNTTGISPGQTFFYNSTFMYQALNSFSYAGEALEDCQTADGTARVGVYAPPVGSPRLDWELPISCQIDGSLNATFSPVDIVLFNGPDENKDFERRNRHAISLCNTAIKTVASVLPISVPCGPGNTTGFTAYKAYEDRGIIDFYPGNAVGVCGLELNNDTHFNASDIRSLLAEFKVAVLNDFAPGGQRIGPLPGLLYPCSPRLRIRAPWRQVAFDCFTNAAAIFGPLYAGVIWLLQYMPRDPNRVSDPRGYNEANEEQGVGQTFPLLQSPALEQPQSIFSPNVQATQ